MMKGESLLFENWSGAFYALPVGNLREDAFISSKGQPPRELIDLIKKADALTVGEIVRVFAELRPSLTVKMVKGEELSPAEKTLRDIDISALISLALLEWEKHIRHV